MRGHAKLLLGDYAGAAADCDEALARNPEDAAALCNAANAQLLLKECGQPPRERLLVYSDLGFTQVSRKASDVSWSWKCKRF